MDGGCGAAEAVDDEFADALTGEVARLEWNRTDARALPARWRWWWNQPDHEHIEVVQRIAPGEPPPDGSASAPPV
jgi:hypothetical protein